MAKFGYSMKRFYFDRQAVVDAIGQAAARGLGKAGAYIRRRAMHSMRKRKKPSKPGQPPSYHANANSLREIQFYYDAQRLSVIVGPILLRTPTNYYGPQLPASQTVPELLEFGGSLTVRERKVGTKWLQYGDRYRKHRTRERRVTVAPRPFMGPALEREVAAGTIPAGFSGLVSS